MFYKGFRNGNCIRLDDLALFHPAVRAWASRVETEHRWFGMAAAFVVLHHSFPATSLRRSHGDLKRALSHANSFLSKADKVQIPTARAFAKLAGDFKRDPGVAQALQIGDLMFLEGGVLGEQRQLLHAQGIREPELSLMLGVIFAEQSEERPDGEPDGGGL